MRTASITTALLALLLTVVGTGTAFAKTATAPPDTTPAAILARMQASEEAGIWRRGTRRLKALHRDDFTPADVRALAALLTRPTVAAAPDLVLVAGWVGDDASVLSGLDAGLLRRNRYLAQRRGYAAVRLGDAAAAAQLMESLERYPVDDGFAEEFAPLLAYTRHRPAVDALLALLATPQMGCTPLESSVPGPEDCGYRFMEVLAPIIEDFPVALGEFGTVLAEDYDAALLDVRRWAKSHADDYVLDQTRF